MSAEPRNLEEHVINLVDCYIYLMLVKGYTEKKLGRSWTEFARLHYQH